MREIFGKFVQSILYARICAKDFPKKAFGFQVLVNVTNLHRCQSDSISGTGLKQAFFRFHDPQHDPFCDRPSKRGHTWPVIFRRESARKIPKHGRVFGKPGCIGGGNMWMQDVLPSENTGCGSSALPVREVLSKSRTIRKKGVLSSLQVYGRARQMFTSPAHAKGKLFGGRFMAYSGNEAF